MTSHVDGSLIKSPTKERIKRLIPNIEPIYGIWVDQKIIHFVTSKHNHIWVNLHTLEWDFLGEGTIHFSKCKELF